MGDDLEDEYKSVLDESIVNPFQKDDNEVGPSETWLEFIKGNQHRDQLLSDIE